MEMSPSLSTPKVLGLAVAEKKVFINDNAGFRKSKTVCIFDRQISLS